MKVEMTKGKAPSLIGRARLKAPAWQEMVQRHQLLLLVICLAVVPLLLPFTSLAILILVFGLFAAAFNVLYGYAGILSLGHAALFGTGAYTCGVLVVRFGLTWPFAVVCGAVAAGLLGVVFALLSLRVRGVYFAMITLALGQCVFFAAFQASSWTGGDNGLRDVVVPPFEVGGFTINMVDPLVRYYVILLFVAFALYFLFRVLSSPFGLTLEMIRENETRARSCGIDVVGAKRLAFVISGVISGLAGALYAIHLSTVPLETLSLNTSGQVVMMVLLGGMGTFSGPFVGAAVFLVAEHVLSDIVSYWQTIVGLLFIFAVLFFPKGIWGSLLALMRERQ